MPGSPRWVSLLHLGDALLGERELIAEDREMLGQGGLYFLVWRDAHEEMR